MNATQNEADIFLAAIEIQSPDERADYVDAACGADAKLRRRVDVLLRRHHESSGMLDAPPPGINAPPQQDAIREKPGEFIGPYKLLEEIGEGGFGVVFLAEQQRPVRRKVALKIIKPGMDTKQVVARFEAERQALAMMDHPNIAKVFDGGTTADEQGTESARPYFVMELVHGVPITDFCNTQKQSTPERLKLFVDVCRAVQHAHQKGIIHRDLKPSNVMVTMHDDKAVPKVIDFGVSKAISQQLTEKTLFTAYGQMVGTPIYMSPEQAQLSCLDVDTRSDVYSLGVLLYELITGSTPFDDATLKRVGFDEMRRIIREDEPLQPSARVSTLRGDLLTTVADQRQIDPRRLRPSLRGEIDWIVMKALEKNRNRRYETAGDLAADVVRYLNDEPVSAAAPSRIYRATKFVRRNKLAVIASAAILIGLVAGIVGTTIGLVSQSRQRAIAERERAEAALNLAAALQSQDKHDEAEKLYRQVLATAGGDSPTDRQRAARTLLRLASTVYQQGNVGESEQLYREAIAAHRAAFPPNDPNLAHAIVTFGLVMRNEGRRAEALSLFREAYDIRRQVTPTDHRATGVSAIYLGSELFWLRQFAEAEPLLREAIAEYQLIVPPDEWLIALARVELGRDLTELGRRHEAEAELLAAAHGLESTRDFPYAASALGAFYTVWEQAEPGKGYDANAREWFLKSDQGYIRRNPVGGKVTEAPPASIESQQQQKRFP